MGRVDPPSGWPKSRAPRRLWVKTSPTATARDIPISRAPSVRFPPLARSRRRRHVFSYGFLRATALSQIETAEPSRFRVARFEWAAALLSRA
jgi:hypothetical protein